MPVDLRNECKDILSEQLGRRLTPNESQRIIPEIRGKMAFLRRQNVDGWDAMTKDERVMMAASYVAADYREAAKAKRRRAQLQLVKAQETQTRYKNAAERGKYGFRAVADILEQTYRDIRGVQQQYFSRIANELEGALPAGFMGLFEDRTKALALVKELRGENSGDSDAKAAAKVVSGVFSDMRERFNRAGGDIGELEDWALPQSHDPDRVLKAASRISGSWTRHSIEENREAWINFVVDKLDRSRYVDPETGELLDDDGLRSMLEKVWTTLVTQGNGDNFGSRVAGQHRASRANHYSQHRALHFKDAESYMRYEQLFGTGSVMSTITNRVRSMSKDIALLESLGPNPTGTFDTLHRIAGQDLERARLTDGLASRAWKYRDWNGSLAVTTEEMWNTLNGNADTPIGIGFVGRFMQGARNLQVAGKLGSALISSFSDIPTYFIAQAVNRINPLTTHFGLLSSFSKQDREFAARAGILADTMCSGLARYYEDNIGSGATAVLADATIKLSLLDAWTNMIRRAFALNYMAATGKLIKSTEWGNLDPYDRMRFEQNGITEEDWKVLRLAKPENYKGCSMLTREAIESIDDVSLEGNGLTRGDRDRVTSKYLSMITNESYMASLEPGLATRAGASRGARRGTLSGEFWRSLMLFKSFPFAMLNNHYQRMRGIAYAVEASTGSKMQARAAATAYAAAVIVGTTVFGAISLQAANLLAGRDLQDMEKAKFWGNAMMKGGGLGVFGDMLYNGVFTESSYGSPNVLNFLGPVAGSVFDTWDVAMSMRNAALYDKETKWQQKALRLVRGNTPFMNIWYGKMVLDHAVFNDINEMLSPGYLRRQRERARKTQGQGYFWRQDEFLPRRLPRMANAPRD